jgi:DnaJ-class molecular chaperone
MLLTGRQLNRANTFHKFLKLQSPEYFAENRIFTCSKCHSTGLNIYTLSDGRFCWDTTTFCDKCNGIGYTGLAGSMQIDLLHYVCKSCDGIGCLRCNDGITDWVSHAMG